MQYINLGCFAFADPSALLGDAGRNELVGPGVGNTYVSLFENFTAPPRGRLQFRAECSIFPIGPTSRRR
jgi:hypothetical protein